MELVKVLLKVKPIKNVLKMSQTIMGVHKHNNLKMNLSHCYLQSAAMD